MEGEGDLVEPAEGNSALDAAIASTVAAAATDGDGWTAQPTTAEALSRHCMDYVVRVCGD